MQFRRLAQAPSIFILTLIAGRGVAADPAMVDLIPPEARIILGADLDQIRDSPFGTFILGRLKIDSPSFRRFAELTGFDPGRDLREAIVATDGIDSREPFVILRGSFDPGRVADLAAREGGLVSSYGGATILSNPKDPRSPAASFLSNSLLIAGPPAAVRAAVDRRKNSVRAPAALVSRLDEISGRYHAWAVTNAPPAQLAPKVNNPNVNSALNGKIIQGIEHMAGGVRFGATVEMGAQAATRSPEDARALVNVAQFFVTMIQGNGAGGAEMTRLLESMRIAADGKTAEFTLTTPAADFEKLFKTAGGAARARRVVLTR